MVFDVGVPNKFPRKREVDKEPLARAYHNWEMCSPSEREIKRRPVFNLRIKNSSIDNRLKFRSSQTFFQRTT